MAGIQTSNITTAANVDLVLDPATGKKVKVTSVTANPGTTPVAVQADGTLEKIDVSTLAEVTDTDAGDWVLIQAGTVRADDTAGTTIAGQIYKIDGDNLGGGKPADPTGPDVSAVPPFVGGDGSSTDPYVISPAISESPGNTVLSEQLITIANQKTFVPVPFTDLSSGAGNRFAQPGGTTDAAGDYTFNLTYTDAPSTPLGSGQIYNGSIKVGTSSVYFKWDVTQIANATVLGPAPAPNASPASVDYSADGKYGTVSGTWADGANKTLTVESGDIEFGVNGGIIDQTAKAITTGDTLAVAYTASVVAAAAEGATIKGTLSDGVGYLQPLSMVKDVTPAAFTIVSLVDRPTSSVATTANNPLLGVNAPTTISLTSATLTDVELSIDGAAFSTGPWTFNPGDTLQARGTTGATISTDYTATFDVGGVSVTWTVTTADADPEIAQPQIVSPVNGTEDLVPQVTLTGDAYVPLNNPGPHTSSDWEVYEADLTSLKTGVITKYEEEEASLWGDGVTTTSGGETFLNGSAFYHDGTWILLGFLANESFRSTDNGDTWTKFTLLNTTDTWRGVAVGQVSGADKWVAVSSSSTIAVSSDGVTWTAASSPPSVTQFTSVAYANGKFVAVRDGGTASLDDRMWYSSDGDTWTKATITANTCPLLSVTYGNNRFVAVGGSTTLAQHRSIFYSSNGTQWFSTGSTNDAAVWESVAYGNGYYVAVASNAAANKIMYTDNPAGAWTGVAAADELQANGGSAGGYNTWKSIAFGGGVFSCVSSTNPRTKPLSMWATDPSTWNLQATLSTFDAASNTLGWGTIGYGGGQFLAAAISDSDGGTRANVMRSSLAGAPGKVITLADDTNLDRLSSGATVEMDSAGTPETSAITNVVEKKGVWIKGNNSSITEWRDVTYGDGTFVAVSSEGGRIINSTDGINWTAAAAPSSDSWNGVAYGRVLTNNVNYFVAVATNSDRGMAAIYSTDGASWGEGTRFTSDWNAVAYGRGRFVAVGQSHPYAKYSDDAVLWQQGSMTGISAQAWVDVAYSGAYFVAISHSGSMYSQTGYDWAPNGSTPGQAGMAAIVYGNGKFVAVGSSDKVWISVGNGQSWTSAPVAERANWSGVTYANGKFVAVGKKTSGENTVMYSIDGNTWVSGRAASYDAWEAVTYGDGKFVAVASAGTGTRTMWSYDGTGVDQATLTLTDDTNLGNFRVGDAVLQGGVTNPGDWDNAFRAGNFSWNSGTPTTVVNGQVWETNGNDNLLWIDTGLLGSTYSITITQANDAVDNIYFNTGSDPDALGNALGTLSSPQIIADATTGTSTQAWGRYIAVQGDSSTSAGYTKFFIGTTGSANGKISSIGATSLILEDPYGTWLATKTVETVFPLSAEAEILSINNTNFKLTVQDVTGRFLETKPGQTLNKLDKSVTDPLIPGGAPGAPATEPPDAATYTKVVDSAGDTSNLLTYPLTDSEIDTTKAYYSRVKYNDDSSTGSLVSSEFSPYNEFTTADSFGGGSNTVLWSGDGQNSHSITGVGFAPDLVWIKCRDIGLNHVLFDSVRGPQKILPTPKWAPSDSLAEFVDTGTLISFDNDGFTLGADLLNGTVNYDGYGRYVGWCWDAGSSTVTNTDGTIPSQVRSSGNFSIVTWDNSSQACTVGHGLNTAPSFIIAKSLTDLDWAVYHSSLGNDQLLRLNQMTVPGTQVGFWSNTSTTMGLPTAGLNNEGSMVAYCWTAQAGKSSFGDYSGTGASGTTITTGFEPGWLMIKRTDLADEWQIYDNKRNPTNPRNSVLNANDFENEVTDAMFGIDFKPTGFEPLTGDNGTNASGASYIYMAFG